MEITMVCDDNAAWQKARELLREVYEVSNAGMFAVDFSFCERLRWSAMAIMLNIADGIKSGSCAEQARFLSLVERATAEFSAALAVAEDRHYLSDQQCASLNSRADEIVAMIGSCLQEACPTPVPDGPPPEESATLPEQKIETRIVRPDLFGWCRGYSADTGLWGWKLRGFSIQR